MQRARTSRPAMSASVRTVIALYSSLNESEPFKLAGCPRSRQAGDKRQVKALSCHSSPVTTLMVRLLALDLDGTLLDAHGRVSARNRRALEAARARGVG